MTIETNKSGIDFNIDAIATDLNNKIDKTDLQEVQCVVETYRNGASWYRVYSDGFCEQGGAFTSVAAVNQLLSFLKPFVDMNYQVFGCNRQTADAGICVICFTNYSKSQCYYTAGYNGNCYAEPFYWMARGYIV